MVHEDELLPLTPRCASIIRAAERISRSNGSEFIGAEHLFIAILKDEYSIPSQVSRRENGEGGTERLIAALLEFIGTDEYRGIVDESLLRGLENDSE